MTAAVVDRIGGAPPDIYVSEIAARGARILSAADAGRSALRA
jgi:hypothetical protein